MKNNFRIISLLPSASDIIFELNLKDYLIAVSHECESEKYFKSLPKVTFSHIKRNMTQQEIDNEIKKCVLNYEPIYKLDIELICHLNPTHIITQGICDVCAISKNMIEASFYGKTYKLPKDVNIISLSGKTFEGICNDYIILSSFFNVKENAQKIVKKARKKWNSLKKQNNKKKMLLLEWVDPPFSPGHWIPEQINLSGFECLFSYPGAASKELSWHQVKKENPDFICTICCGYGLKENLKFGSELYKNQIIKGTNAILNENIFGFDSESFFSKPTLKIVEGAELISNILNKNKQKFRCFKPSKKN